MTTFSIVAGMVLALLGGLALYATQREPYRPVLRRVTLRLPAGWPRLSVLHLSDLHVRADGDRMYRSQERFLRSLDVRPDLVCVTGDVCEQRGDAERAAALIKQIQPRLGTLVILGNHEHDAPIPAGRRSPVWKGMRRVEKLVWRLFGPRGKSSGSAESRDIAAALKRAGLQVLVNEGVRLDVDGRSLWVAGIDSVWAGLSRATAALQGRRTDEPCLALVHEPEGAFPFVARGAALVLAGHTHGGQVRLPFIGPPYSHRVDRRISVAAGVQQIGHSLLHISAGLGQSIPFRFRCPPEAIWISCVPAAPEPVAAGSLNAGLTGTQADPSFSR